MIAMDKTIAIGIDIGGTNIKSGIVGEDGSVIEAHTVPTEVFKGKPAIVRKVIDQVRHYRQLAEANRWNVAGAGIGTAGYVDANGIVAGATANIPGWSGTDLAAELHGAVGIPAVVDNDANVMAMGEAWVGVGKRWSSFLCVTLGTGIGGCLIENKKPYRGRNGFAGGYGHQIIVAGGHPCTCGGSGCWEQYASARALHRLIEEAGLSQQPETLFADARGGNADAMNVIDQYAAYIAVGLVNLIHILNPPSIVIGGAIAAQGRMLFERIEACVRRQAMPVYLCEPTPIVPAALGNDAGVVGAAGMVFHGR